MHNSKSPKNRSKCTVSPVTERELFSRRGRHFATEIIFRPENHNKRGETLLLLRILENPAGVGRRKPKCNLLAFFLEMFFSYLLEKNLF